MLSEAQKFLASVNAKATKKIFVEVKGKEVPFIVKSLEDKEYNEAMNLTTSMSNGKVQFNQTGGDEYICLRCIVEPDFKQQEWIDYVNEEIKRRNIEKEKAAEEKYLKETEEYEAKIKAGEKAKQPKKDKVELEKECLTSKDLLKTILSPGNIRNISDKIMDLSGFNNKVKDDIEETKNS